jgi:hypothetical protein
MFVVAVMVSFLCSSRYRTGGLRVHAFVPGEARRRNSMGAQYSHLHRRRQYLTGLSHEGLLFSCHVVVIGTECGVSPQGKRYPWKTRNGDDYPYGQVALESNGAIRCGWYRFKQFEGEYRRNAEVDCQCEPLDSDKKGVWERPKHSHSGDIWASRPCGRTIGPGEVDASDKEDAENDGDGPGDYRENAGKT